MLMIDHVIYGTRDAGATAARLRAEHGLGSLEGGFHPAHGTHNWVVPLQPPQYLELLEVVDREAAARSPLGERLAEWLAKREGLFSWAVLTDDIDTVAARLGLEAQEGHIVDEVGRVGTSWRTVFRDSDLPFFIAYNVDSAHRRAVQRQRYHEARHTVAPTSFAWIEVGGDRDRLESWLGDTRLPLRFIGGSPGPHAVGITAATGEIVLR